MKVRTAAAVAWALWGMSALALAIAAWLDHLLEEAGRPDLGVLDASTLAVALPHLVLATVGAVIATRRPRHPVGWLLLMAFGVLGQASFVVAGYADYGLLARPGALPAAWLAGRYFPAMAAAGFTCLAFILVLTPTGSLPSAWAPWRWWAKLTAAAPIALLLTGTLAPRRLDQPYESAAGPFDLHGYDGALLVAYQVGFSITLGAIAVAAVSLVVRFRRASGTERQQLRWVALAGALIALLFVIVVAGRAIRAPTLLDAGNAGAAALVILSLGISAATLRYRLYDLDRIIGRTLVYGMLTVVLGLIYAAGVVGGEALVGAVAGQKSNNLVVAASTLVVAALFRPARGRIQSFIDRRFYRSRYDAARIVESFSRRVRDEVALEAVTSELMMAVQQTLQPERASLWLARADHPSLSGAGSFSAPRIH
ncbi:MAG: hypothetical protein ABR505_06135 [Actinomycetota bacterium]